MAQPRKQLQVGTAVEQFGTTTRGHLHLLDLPTGISVNLSVVIVSGAHDGPTFLLTANIHGDEVNGVIVVHRFLGVVDHSKLHGRIVIFPSLNPTGHLTVSRFPLFDPRKDPNRCWPEYRPKNTEEKKADEKVDPWDFVTKKISDEVGPQERVFVPIAEEFKKIQPDFHVDLHTFSTLSLPFIFLDRVLYEKTSEDSEEKAKKLWKNTQDMVNSIGLTVVNERPAWLYVKDKLHRSTSGYTLNALQIPSCTIELGPMEVAHPGARDAGLVSLHNCLVWGKMLHEQLKPITTCKVLKFDQPLRYLVYPQVEKTGIVDHQLEVGDSFSAGTTLAIVRSIDGTHVADVKAEMDGYLIGWWNGVARYAGNTIGMVAVNE